MPDGKLVAISTARLGSKRCPYKMIRPFAGETLAEIAVRRLSMTSAFDEVYFAAWEDDLKRIVRQYANVRLIERSERSATADGPVTLVHEYLKEIRCDYVMWVNCCHPLLRAATLDAAANFFRMRDDVKSMTAVVKKHTWYYWPDGTPVNNRDPYNLNTMTTPVLLEACHAFHVFEKDRMFREGVYWSNVPGDPHLYVIDPLEAVDIDTPQEFCIAEQLYLGQKEGRLCPAQAETCLFGEARSRPERVAG